MPPYVEPRRPVVAAAARTKQIHPARTERYCFLSTMAAVQYHQYHLGRKEKSPPRMVF